MTPIERIGPPVTGSVGPTVQRRQRPARDSNEDERRKPQKKRDDDGEDDRGRHRIDELA